MHRIGNIAYLFYWLGPSVPLSRSKRKGAHRLFSYLHQLCIKREKHSYDSTDEVF